MDNPAARYKQNRLPATPRILLRRPDTSISKAAEQMLLSQPSVSLQIKALERELGGNCSSAAGHASN